MNRAIRGALRLPLLAVFLTAGGCAGGGLGGLGGLGDILGSMGGMGGGGQQQQGEVVAQVQQVDESSRRISIQTQNGQSGWVNYDQQTQVIYQNQQYQVANLERGDVVQMRVQQDQNGNLYTNYIVVTQNVRDSGGGVGGGTGTGQIQRFEGQVGQINHQQGWFELRPSYGGSYQVTMPYGATNATRDYFNRLRSGSSVRVEGQMVSQNRIELSRFY